MRILSLIFITTLLFANNITDLVKNIPKNTPEYSLGLILESKINNLKFIPSKYDLSTNNSDKFIKNFNTLIQIKTQINLLTKQIDNLNKQINVLNSDNAIDQLQKIYYQQQNKIYQKQLDFLNNNYAKWEKELFDSLKNISFNTKIADKNIDFLNKKLIQLQKKAERLQIDLQKWKLLDNNKKINQVKSFLIQSIDNKKIIYQKLFNNNLIIWSFYLQTKNKKAFEIDNKLINYSKFIYDIEIDDIITHFEKKAFGKKYFIYGVKQEIYATLHKIGNILNYPLFTVGNRTITPINFFIFIIILVFGWFIGKYYKKFIYSLRHKYNISYSTATLMANMGYYILIVLSFLISLKVIGLDLSSLAIIAGALSVGIGFGLQNVVSNFVSGIILMFERSIKVGDYIQIDNDTRGEILDISMRSTVIRTNDNINLIIPNQSFIQNNVINWTLGDDIVRFRVPFGVAYGTNIEKVEDVILGALHNSDLPYIKQYKNLDTTPYVVFMEMGDSSLNFELFVWVKGEYARRPRRTRSKFLKMIYNSLNKAGIVIPFPQQDLYIKECVPFEIKINNDIITSNKSRN